MLYLKKVKGHKSSSDTIIRIKTDGWHQITYEELADILIPLMENEERLYPQSEGYSGWQKPLEYLIQRYDQMRGEKVVQLHKESK